MKRLAWRHNGREQQAEAARGSTLQLRTNLTRLGFGS